ncbi:MAG TPA: hypothetical protein VFX65_11140 [Candidatus Limnocylindrales bacterium]|nr:hypothetical protein [Candidatus Limnocylindrales bacterium]
MAWLVTALRRLRDERLSALGLAALVLVTAFVAAAAPRLHERVADDTLRSSVMAAVPQARNIQLLREGREEGGTELFASVEALGEDVHELLPEEVAALVVERAWTIETGRWLVPQAETDVSTIRFRFQPDAADRIHLESGRWPTEATREVPDPTSEETPAPLITAFEVVLSVETSRALGAQLGEVLALPSDSSDQLVGRGHDWKVAMEVVGLYAVDDPSDPWWLGSTDLVRPTFRHPIPDLRINDATALLAPEAYRAYLSETQLLRLPMRYTFREYVDPERLDSDTVDSVLLALRRIEAELPATSVTFNQPTAFRTGLRALLETYRSRWASASAILTVGAVGPATVAAGALALVAVLAAERRRSALALARGRGASLSQVVTAVVAEGLVLAGPAAAIAVAIAVLAVPADALAVSLAAGGVVAVLAVVLLVIGTVPATGGPSFGAGRTAAVPKRPSARRLLFEGLVIVAAVAGAALLRERGVRGVSSTGDLGAADPLLAAVPALIGVAAGLVAVRLVPPAMRILAALARRGRGLVPILAMRRASHGQGIAPVLLVLLATAAIGAFSTAVLLHLDRAAETVAWREVGAAHRVDSVAASIGSSLDVDALPDVEASAVAWSSNVNVGPRNLRVEFVALAVADYDEVASGTPADPDFPVDLYATGTDVVPLVVSRAVAERADGLPLGMESRVTIQGYTFTTRVVAVRDDLPALSSNDHFVIASRDQIRVVAPTAPLSPSTIYLRAPDDSAEEIRDAVLAAIPAGVTVRSRALETLEIQTSPISRAVVAGVAAAAIVAIGYAMLAVAAALALAGASRAVEVAHLRTLGLTGRQAAGLVVAEHGPAVAVALGIGAALGIGMFVALRQGLGLEALVGSSIEVAIVVDPLQLVAVSLAIAVVVAGGLVLGTLMQRGAAPVAAVRRGFE